MLPLSTFLLLTDPPTTTAPTGDDLFAGRVRCTLDVGPLYRATLTVDTGDETMLPANASGYVRLTEIENAITDAAITAAQITSATCTVYDRKGATPLTGADALALTLDAGPPLVASVVLPATLAPTRATVDVEAHLVMSDGTSARFWQEAVAIGRVPA